MALGRLAHQCLRAVHVTRQLSQVSLLQERLDVPIPQVVNIPSRAAQCGHCANGNHPHPDTSFP